MSMLMCPHCGWKYDPSLFEGAPFVKHSPYELVPPHNADGTWADLSEACLGTEQHPRNPESDRRRLWGGEPNPHLGR